jgi:hypothetical protein
LLICANDVFLDKAPENILMQDVLLAPQMLAKGKLAMFPHKVQNTKAIAEIFKKILAP